MDEDDDELATLPSTTIPDEADEQLEYTQGIRRSVIEKLLMDAGEKGIPGIPTDKESAQLLSMFLDGMDRQRVSVKRIQVARKDSNTREQAAKLLEAIAHRQNSGDHDELIEIDITPKVKVMSQADFLTGDFLPEPTVTSGELTVGISDETPDDFFKRVEAENPDLLTGGDGGDEEDY